MELIKSLFSGIRPDEQIYVGWKDASGQASYTMDEWKKLPWHVELFDTPQDVEAFCAQYPQRDIYYGIAHRQRGDINALSRVTALWAEVDAQDFGGNRRRTQRAAESFPAPCSFVVESGHGYHLYWLLSGPVAPDYAQEVMKRICAMIGADHVHNAKVVLRVPGTHNWKECGNPLPVREIIARPELRYAARDLETLCGTSPHVRDMITQGKVERGKSRSEADWRVMSELLDLGVSEEAIRAIFAYQPVGEKSREDGEHYFSFTLDKARKRRPRNASPIEEDEEGYVVRTAQGGVRISTFTFSPTKLLTSEDGLGEDAFLGTMEAAGEQTPDVVLPKSAFATTTALLRSLPKMEWQWWGTDTHAKLLLLYLHERWSQGTHEQAVGTTAIGRHREYWVTKGGCLSKTGYTLPEVAPYVYFDLGGSRMRETHTVPETSYPLLDDGEYAPLAQAIATLLPKINLPEIILPALGWFCACPLKPLLLANEVRFPHLNIFGTTGSGKTTLLKEVLFKLLGVVDPHPWTPNTTMFILRALLGGSNAIPVHFGEYRTATLHTMRNDFLRVVLQAYDVGVDARGRADLSTESYELLAPIIIDGEDAVGDPAFTQRAIVLNPHPADIAKGTPQEQAFQDLQGVPLGDFAGRYIQRTLAETPDSVKQRFLRALERTMHEYPGVLPDRVRRNIAVVLVGLEIFNEHVSHYGGSPVDPTGVFQVMIEDTLGLFPTGAPRVAVDDFVEEVVNALAYNGQRPHFLTCYDAAANILWLHLSSAHRWWERERRSRGRATLEVPALRAQMRERYEYVIQEQVVNTGTYGRLPCFGIRVANARNYGLSIPDRLDTQQFIVNGAII